MAESRTSADGPPVADIESVFHVDEVHERDETLYYLGTPLTSTDDLEHELWPLFHEAGYSVRLTTRSQVDADVGAAGDDHAVDGDSDSRRTRSDSDDGRAGGADRGEASVDPTDFAEPPDVTVKSPGEGHADEPEGTGETGGSRDGDVTVDPVGETDVAVDAADIPAGHGDATRPNGGAFAGGRTIDSRYVLVAEPRGPHIDGVPWLNLVFFMLTVGSTLLVGTTWYYIPMSAVQSDPLVMLEALPFVLAILGPLAVHELGHYVMIRYYDVDASLPYFIPFPSLIGTMGAVIRMRGRIPSRKALFDIGVAGPLAGLVATVVVTVVGLYVDPITVPERVLDSPSTTSIRFNYPLLLQGLGWLTGQPLTYADPTKTASPIIFGGWVGMFVTLLNLLPVGQFDGGHITRAVFGPRQETLAAVVPVALFALAGYVYVFRDATNAVVLWGFWGVLAIALAYGGPATPIDDQPLDARRKAVAALTFVLGALCFVPVPFQILAV
jgi:membrane-associated protease RseP (regulator of RpoE activity)